MKKRFILMMTVLVLLASIQNVPCATEHRVALVIGNSEYRHSRSLINPANDALDMAQALETCGFSVSILLDATRRDMLNAIRKFGKQINCRDCVGLFFFSGHGVQVKNVNYLAPVDARMEHENEVEDYCVKASAVLRKMETASNKLNIIILDACRNNPLVGTSRTSRQGLAQETAPPGSLIAFATAPNTTASDGFGSKNSPYTASLLKHLIEPGLPIFSLFNRVGNDVKEASGGEQVPWFHTSPLPEDFTFVAGGTTVVERSQPEKKITNSIGQEFVLIPSGTFTMGSPSDEKYRRNDETQHEVSITKSFYMQTTEVTQGQWKAVMGNNPSRFTNCGDDCPVENVSWKDAREFIRRLNQKEGDGKYRLPTEAEWEYACRAGSKTIYYFGNYIGLETNGWYWYNSRNEPHPVGGKLSNSWGLFDMAGNVWEWCQDVYSGTAYKELQQNDPLNSGGGARVVRGGSWNVRPWGCRSAFRIGHEPSIRNGDIGFRLARSL